VLIVIVAIAAPGQKPTSPNNASNAGTSTTTPTATAATGPGVLASAALAILPIHSAAGMSGYSRDSFGPAWADVDHNGCDTRDDILHRDLTAIHIAANHCTITTGTLADPYTGKTIHFVRGTGTSTAVQIDHVVALGDAWTTGAAASTSTRREDFANDPLNLLAVNGPSNESKGDRDAASWLPPNRSYDCRYVARQIEVKTKYHLWITTAEHKAMVTVLAGCPNQPLPPTGAVATAAPTKTPAPAPKPTTKKPTAPPTVSGAVHSGAYCSQHGSYGYTIDHVLMQCKTSATDTRYRWRKA
jgi:hypothetical protein